LAYQGKEDKKSMSLADHATASKPIKFEIDVVWVAWLAEYKQVKSSLKIIAATLSQYMNFILNFKCHVDAGNKECRGLSLSLGHRRDTSQ
jgi:hypothetical protein